MIALSKKRSGIIYLSALIALCACNKDNTSNMDEYSFRKLHQENSSSSWSDVNASFLPFDKKSEFNFEGTDFAYFRHGQPDLNTYLLFTPDGDYNYSPYSGATFEYFFSNDSIYCYKWYDGSHTDSESDMYYGNKN